MSGTKDGPPRMASSHDIKPDSEYIEWIHEIKRRYRQAQIKAAVKVNSEQLAFNWQLGRDLVERKAEEKWGGGIVEKVSLDLQNEFPDVKGFSVRNLRYMKQWYLFYSGFDLSSAEKGNRSLHDLKKNSDVEIDDVILHQDGAETGLPSFFLMIPWRHHVEIITKCDSVEQALFYVRRSASEGWSRSVLINMLDSDLYGREGRALTNFGSVLPENQARLAQEITKDTYDLGFIELPPDYSEEMLESALEKNITRFLLELGTGFAFVGRQKEIIVAGKPRRIDMLFYHIRLRCYIVIELKAVSFEPEFAGKLNFYVNAVDELLKACDDNPTVGLLICRDKDQTEVKWAFQGIQTPLGVASYENVRIKELRDYLPTDEQIKRQVELAEKDYIMNLHDKSGGV